MLPQMPRRMGATPYALWAIGFSLLLPSAGFAAPATPLPLSVAITRATERDPAIAATQNRLDAAAGSIQQAGVRPNPSIGLEVENFAGSAPFNGLSQAETTLSYQQPLERGGKRKARLEVANAERELVLARGHVRSWEIASEVQSLWVEALAAEAEVALAADRLDLARQAQSEIGRRVDAARDPLFAGSLADSDLASAKIALDQARAKSDQLKTQLASYWNGGAEFDLNTAWLEDVSAATSEPILFTTPDIELLRAQRRVASAQIEVETSRRYQDPVLQAGVRHFQGDGAVAVIIGGSIPIGRFDTNKGNIARAEAEASAAAVDIEVAERSRAREVSAISRRLQNIADEVRRIEAEVIPQAARAVKQVREGFTRGGFTYRDVIGAQETLIAAKERRVNALKSFHLERAKRDRLVGIWMPLILGTEADND